MMIDLMNLLHKDFDLSGLALTNKQKQIVRYILDHSSEVCYISLKELSQKAGCTEVTLLRLFQRLGFSGFSEFKREFRRCYEIHSLHTQEAAHNGSHRTEEQNELLLRRICERETQHITAYLDALDLHPIIQAARAIAVSDYTMLMGRGLSKSIMEFLSYRLGMLGIRTIEVNPEESNTLRGRLSSVDSRTTVVAITFPRYFDEMRSITEFAATKGARVIGITDDPTSPIVPHCSPVIYCTMARGTIYNSYVSVLEVINLIAHFIAIEQGVGNQKQKQASLEILRMSAGGCCSSTNS